MSRTVHVRFNIIKAERIDQTTPAKTAGTKIYNSHYPVVKIGGVS
jgi:hypothetical protein